MLEQIGIFFGIFITSFVVALSGALMPGPLLSVTISESAKKGAWVGPLLIVGHGILELAFVGIILWGLGELLQKDIVLSGIAFFGSVILLWMGFTMIQGAKTLTLEGELKKTEDKKITYFLTNPIAAGIIVSLSNPYWTIWWLTIGLAYVFMSIKFGILGLAVFFVGHILADFVWYTIVSTSVSYGKRFLSDRVYRGIIVFCGFFLLSFSIYFFWTGFDYLLRS
jgi:threonine/homoserine/homoserine lactone efflux protein